MRNCLLTACLIAIPYSTNAAPVYGQGTWESTLQGRDFDGDLTTTEAYYDTVLNVTWLADANYARTSGYDSDGGMSWSDASTWANTLNFYGVTGWRLPNADPIDGIEDALVSYIGTEDRGYNISAPGTLYGGSTASEMAHMFYNTLGNLGYCDPVLSTVDTCSPDQPGWGLTNTASFTNIMTDGFAYFASREYELGAVDNAAWGFYFVYGNQGLPNKFEARSYAWAVHDGDVGSPVVPVPAAIWLFGSGLLSLIGLARRKAL